MRIVERYPPGFAFAGGTGAWRALFPLRLALAGLYGALSCAARRAALASGRRPVSTTASGKRPFVVSVGNISAGGGGKTPCVIALAEEIRSRAGTAVVVSRGYGGAMERRGPCVVGGAGASAELARTFGDEVALYAARGIPVVTDARRRRGAALAADLFAPTHILLDDAFQHHSLAKDLDILLLDAGRPFEDGMLLPAGRLRELPGAARRAGAVIFTRAREERVPAAAERFVAGKPVFFARHEAAFLKGRGGASEPLSIVSGREVVLFSGIARPDSFEETVVSLGAAPRASFRFEDHHRYAAREIEEIVRAGSPEALFLTTEKDFVKAGDLFPPGAAVFAIAIEMRISGLERLGALLGLGG
jgi:tetraacyldisaccharide 4'-kinase